MDMRAKTRNEELEIELLLDAIYKKHGYSFSDYSRVHITRRIKHFMGKKGLKRISDVQHRIIWDFDCFNELLSHFSINVTEMFRDPAAFKFLRQVVREKFRDSKHLKVWTAGCSSGEELYSLAIIFHEEGLYDKTTFYATDFNEVMLDKARDGIYPIGNIKKYTDNYNFAGGQHSLSDYYTARYDSVIMKSFLKEKVLFADHNLVTDATFGEMDLILCRNVVIYFNEQLQRKVFGLFTDSMAQNGLLCLGTKETLKFSRLNHLYQLLDPRQKIYQFIGEQGQ